MVTFSVGDPVHFLIPASIAPLEIGGTSHAGVVMIVEGARCLIALHSPSKLNLYPWLHVGDGSTKMIGLTWLKIQMLRTGHGQCHTTLTMSLEEAQSLEGKIRLHKQVLDALEAQGRCWDLPGKPKTPTPPASPRQQVRRPRSATSPGSPRQQSVKQRKHLQGIRESTEVLKQMSFEGQAPQRRGIDVDQTHVDGTQGAFSGLMGSRLQARLEEKLGPRLLPPEYSSDSPNRSPAMTPPPVDIPPERIEGPEHLIPLQEAVFEQKLVQGSDSVAVQYIMRAFEEGSEAMQTQHARLQAEMDNSIARLQAATESLERTAGGGAAHDVRDVFKKSTMRQECREGCWKRQHRERYWEGCQGPQQAWRRGGCNFSFTSQKGARIKPFMPPTQTLALPKECAPINATCSSGLNPRVSKASLKL